MAEIFILSPEDELLAVLSSDGQDSCNFWDAKYKEELNLGSSFSFIADASHPDAKYLFEENQAVFRDKDGELRAFVIKELDDSDDGDEINTLVTCEAAMMELAETFIKEKRPKDRTAQYVLDQVFERTRWTAEVTAELGLNSTSFYKMNALECLSDVLEKWGGEFKDVVEFDGNTITKRTIKVLPRRGKDSGKRFEIDKDTESIRRTVISYPKTALYGYGASLQTTNDDGEETGGYSRFIDFSEVEWKKETGDPVDKPKGQEWVGDPTLLEKYGRLKDGVLIHREDIFSNEDIEDPEELLKATYNHLIAVASKTEVNYELSVKLLEGIKGYEHEHVDLGDTTIAIDRNFAIPIETSQRIISMEYDITDPENTCVVEIGQFLSALQGDDRVKQLQKVIDNNRGTWERKPEAGNVTDSSFLNTKPPTPANIKAEGLYKTISLTWDYDTRSFIAAYEVYASQNKGFTPTAAQLIFRGKTGGWHHQDGVEADQVWYYRLRAINTHGTASDWSDEYEAKTVRILTDDIMFGAVTADKLASLSVTADKLYTDLANSNILPGSLFRSSDIAGLNSSSLAVNEQEYNEVTITKTRTNNKLFGVVTDYRKSLKLVNGETYTFSIEVKRGDLKNFNYLNFRYYNTPTNHKSHIVNTPFSDISNLPSDEFVRLDCTFTYTGDTANNYFVLFGASTENATDAGSFVVRKCQIRMGETIKEWSPSPYDVMLTEKSVTALHVNDAAIGTAAIQNAAIQKAHLGTAIIDTAHITDGAITNAKIANLSADKITAGTIKGITIEGSLIRGARIEPISGSTAYESFIEADQIYQYRKVIYDFTVKRYEKLTIKSGLISQEYGNRIGENETQEPISTVDIKRGGINLFAEANPRNENISHKLRIETNPGVPNDLGVGSSGTHMIFSQNDEMVLKVSVDLNRGEPNFSFNGLKTGHVASLRSYSVTTQKSSSFSSKEDISFFAEEYLTVNGRIRTDIFGRNGINISASNGRVAIEGKAEKDGGISLDGGAWNGSLFLGKDNTGKRVWSEDIYWRLYTQPANVYITQYGTLGRVVSSEKYKINIEEYPDDKAENILKLKPKTWFDKQVAESYAEILESGSEDDEDRPFLERVPGLIAEDLYEAGLKEYLFWSDPDENGERQIEGVMYDRLYALLIPIVKELKDKVNVLENQIKGMGH
ncbi:phage tail spike protein [Bacillus sp. 179-C3.3 HS]|uniref:phage tail spike protein n=1 Tax=Bacillus sp. 179-C3.3 HS TaxID=3232162 RepID=UPI0039A0AE5F